MTKNLVLISTLMLMIAVSAIAQTKLTGADVRVTIPFSFYAGDQALPAGVYSARNDIEHQVMVLRSQKTGGLFVSTNRLEAQNVPTTGRLMFKRYGSNYFLQEVWVAGKSEGQQIRPGKLEKELASKSGPVEMVMVQPHSH